MLRNRSIKPDWPKGLEYIIDKCVQPYFCICIVAVFHYMISGKKENVMLQIFLVKQVLQNWFSGGMANNEF